MITRIFLIGFFLLMLMTSCRNRFWKVEPLSRFDDMDTSLTVDKKFRKSKSDNYLLNGVNKYRIMMLFTDSIVYLTKGIEKYEHYTISFYKPSDKTSIENLEQRLLYLFKA